MVGAEVGTEERVLAKGRLNSMLGFFLLGGSWAVYGAVVAWTATTVLPSFSSGSGYVGDAPPKPDYTLESSWAALPWRNASGVII